MRDGPRDAAAGVLRNVPVLDACGIAVASRAVVGVGGNVADSVDVGEVVDGERLVCSEGAVFFQRYGFIVLEEVCGWRNADAEDDEVGGEGGAVFEFDGADRLGVGLVRDGGVDGGGEVKFNTFLGDNAVDDLAYFGAHDALERNGFHADD